MHTSAKLHGPLNNSGGYAIFILNPSEVRYIDNCDAVGIVESYIIYSWNKCSFSKTKVLIMISNLLHQTG